MPRRDDDFARGYTPALGDVVHLDWAPSQGREMRGPHYALVLSADLYNVATGLVVVCPITSKVGKLSDFEFTLRAGRVNGAAILSEVRSLDYQSRSIQYQNRIPPADIAEANRRVRMIFP